ncbi:MAG: hypothetical protein WKF59_20670 [Chitinophagaceae bacterium]
MAQRALEDKKNEMLEKWFYKNIPTYYINVDNEYKDCPEMKKWMINATATK